MAKSHLTTLLIIANLKMSETTNILHNEGIEGVEKYYNRKLNYVQIICWIIFATFMFSAYFGLKYAHTCEIQDKVISKQQEIIQFYKSQSIMVNDYIKKNEVKVLRPKRND